MSLGPFDPRLLTRGFSYYANPSAGPLLEMLGRHEEERIESMASMLRNSASEEIKALGTIFGLALTRLAEEEALEQVLSGSRRRRRDPDPLERPRRRRGLSAAEWREERRRAS